MVKYLKNYKIFFLSFLWDWKDSMIFKARLGCNSPQPHTKNKKILEIELPYSY
jgi:hypothetical protein